MHKHIFPIISLICLTIAIFLLLYEYFQKGIVTRDVWLTLLLMVSVFMINIPYWKDYFKKCTYRNLSGGIVSIHSGWKF